MNNDYIILFDENGEPYLEHAFGDRLKSYAKRKASEWTNHKYIAKLPDPKTGKMIYFYNQHDLDVFQNGGKGRRTLRNRIQDALGFDERSIKQDAEKKYWNSGRTKQDREELDKANKAYGRTAIGFADNLGKKVRSLSKHAKLTIQKAANKTMTSISNAFKGAAGRLRQEKADEIIEQNADVKLSDIQKMSASQNRVFNQDEERAENQRKTAENQRMSASQNRTLDQDEEMEAGRRNRENQRMSASQNRALDQDEEMEAGRRNRENQRMSATQNRAMDQDAEMEEGRLRREEREQQQRMASSQSRTLDQDSEVKSIRDHQAAQDQAKDIQKGSKARSAGDLFNRMVGNTQKNAYEQALAANADPKSGRTYSGQELEQLRREYDGTLAKKADNLGKKVSGAVSAVADVGRASVENAKDAFREEGERIQDFGNRVVTPVRNAIDNAQRTLEEKREAYNEKSGRNAEKRWNEANDPKSDAAKTMSGQQKQQYQQEYNASGRGNSADGIEVKKRGWSHRAGPEAYAERQYNDAYKEFRDAYKAYTRASTPSEQNQAWRELMYAQDAWYNAADAHGLSESRMNADLKKIRS